MSFPDTLHFTVSFPTDGGFLSRECNAPSCKRHFKVHKEYLKSEMHCPYCGELFPGDQLWTDDQAEFAKETVMREAAPILKNEIDAIFRKAFTGPGWTFTPGTPDPAPPPLVPPDQPKVDSELACPDCGVRFQVDGIFGFCPGCRSENLRLYDANLAIIRNEVSKSEDPSRALRHAYTDLVSTFEIFCRKEATTRQIPTGRFQNLKAAREYFTQHLGVDICAALDAHQEIGLRRAFQKRHAFEHNDGMIDDRYIREVPEDSGLRGQRATLALEELEIAAHAVRQMLEILVRSRRDPCA